MECGDSRWHRFRSEVFSERIMDFQKLTSHKAFIPTALGLLSGIYYYVLYSRLFTWVYTSADAGDWLTQLRWWMVPHVFGKPLYILSVKLVGLSPIGTDVDKITVGLSVIPAAITVAVSYLIAYQMTNDRTKSTVAALVLVGAVVFLSQATVLEQYTFVSMWLALAYLNYLKGNKKLTLLFLGLTTASHIVGLVFFVLWMYVERKQWREWLRIVWVFAVSGLLPYTLILGLMAADTPRLLAGGLSWSTFDTYLTNPTSTSALALTELPNRLLTVLGEVVVSLGLALVAIFKVGKWDKYTKIAVVTLLFALWFHVNNWFPSTYKYLAVALPVAVGLVAVGLTRMKPIHTRLVLASAVVLISANAYFFNADKLANDDPQASGYVEALWDLPDGSGVIAPQGGAWGFGLFYVMSQGKDLVPIMQHSMPVRAMYGDYLEWVEREHGLIGNDVLELAQNALDKGMPLYYARSPSELWGEVFVLKDAQIYNFLWVVEGVNMDGLNVFLD